MANEKRFDNALREAGIDPKGKKIKSAYVFSLPPENLKEVKRMYSKANKAMVRQYGHAAEPEPGDIFLAVGDGENMIISDVPGNLYEVTEEQAMQDFFRPLWRTLKAERHLNTAIQ